MLAVRADTPRESGYPWRASGAPMQRAYGAGRLSLGLRDGRTVIRECYQEAGLRIRMPRVEPGAAFEAVVINTAGGITGGDRFELAIHAGDGTRAVVTSQAAEKAYRSSGGFGTFDTRIEVGAGADLAWLPQEAILFDGSALERRLTVAMAESASFLAVESVVFGRTARGETVEQGYVFDRWRIRRGGRLVYAEGMRFEGDVAGALARPACGAGATACSSLLWLDPHAADRLEALREITEGLAARGVEAGASAFEGMLSVRLLSADSFALRTALVNILELIRGPLPRVWSC